MSSAAINPLYHFFYIAYEKTAVFKVSLRNTRTINDTEWHDFDSVVGGPKATKKFIKEGYDSAVNIKKTPAGPMYVPKVSMRPMQSS